MCLIGHLNVCHLIIKKIKDKTSPKNNGWMQLYVKLNGCLDVFGFIIKNLNKKHPVNNMEKLQSIWLTVIVKLHCFDFDQLLFFSIKLAKGPQFRLRFQD